MGHHSFIVSVPSLDFFLRGRLAQSAIHLVPEDFKIKALGTASRFFYLSCSTSDMLSWDCSWASSVQVISREALT